LDDIEVDLTEIGRDGVDWIYFVQNRVVAGVRGVGGCNEQDNASFIYQNNG
jgi:hypothetical protein